MFTLLHLLPRLTRFHSTNTHYCRIAQVSFVLCLVNDITEPSLFLAQSCQIFENCFPSLITCTQTNIYVVSQVIAQYSRLGFFNIDKLLVVTSLPQCQNHRSLMYTALFIQKVVACIL